MRTSEVESKPTTPPASGAAGDTTLEFQRGRLNQLTTAACTGSCASTMRAQEGTLDIIFHEHGAQAHVSTFG